MLRTALITLTAVAAFGMSSAVAHHGGGGRGGGGHGGHSGYSSGAVMHSNSLKAGIARTTQSRAEFHNRSFSGFAFPHYDNAYYSCRTPVPNYYGWPSANVCGGYRW